MAEINGSDVLLKVNTGTVVSPVWTEVGSQSNVTFREGNDLIDVSSKESGSRKLLPGRYSSSVTLDGFYVPSAADFLALQDAVRNRSTILVVRYYGANIEKAEAVVADLTDTYPDQEGATISVTLEITGDWSAV